MEEPKVEVWKDNRCILSLPISAVLNIVLMRTNSYLPLPYTVRTILSSGKREDNVVRHEPDLSEGN